MRPYYLPVSLPSVNTTTSYYNLFSVYTNLNIIALYALHVHIPEYVSIYFQSIVLFFNRYHIPLIDLDHHRSLRG